MPDRDKVVADYAGARELFTDYLEREQTQKAAAQTRLETLSNSLDLAVKRGDTVAQRATVDAIEKELQAWRGKSGREAISAIKTREANLAAGSTAGTASAGDAVAAAVKRILAGDQTLSRQELRSRAQEWVDRLIGSPDGRLDYDVQPSSAGFHSDLGDLRGSLKGREMAIDVNQLIKNGYINTSAKQGTASLLRSVVPDALLTQHFGDVSMENTFRKINEEYAAKAVAGKDSTRLFKERDGVINDLAATRDRFRGLHVGSKPPIAQVGGGRPRFPEPQCRNQARNIVRCPLD